MKLILIALLAAAPAFAGPFDDYPGGITGAPATPQQEADFAAALSAASAALSSYSSEPSYRDRAIANAYGRKLTTCKPDGRGGLVCVTW